MDEGEDGDLVDGNHGAVSATPAAVTTTEGGAMMEDETEIENEGHGEGPAAPTKHKTEEGDLTMERLKTEFNIKEFFELASRVIEDGDLESMEVLNKLKNKWINKLGGEVSLAGNGGFRPVRTRQPTPFPAPSSRPAWRVLRKPTAEQAAHVSSAPTLGSVEPHLVKSPRGPLAALTFDTSTAASPRSSAQPTTPSPWKATTMVAEEGELAIQPLSPEEAPPVEVWSPSSLNPMVNHPSAGSKLGLNGTLHHQPPARSSSPTDLVQPTETRPPLQSWDRVEMPHHQPAIATLPTPLNSPLPPTTAPPATTAAPAKSLPEFFIGNIPFHPHMPSKIDEDKIATAFHNSSRKILNFIPPSVQNGEVIVRPSIDMIRAGSQRWNTTAVGYFLGKKPYFHHLNEFVRSIWPGVRDVKATSNGFFFFQFNSVAAMEEVIEGGPWLYLGQPIVLQKWEPGMVLRKLKHTEVPVWIKLRHLPVELWTTEGLSTVASGIGRPLYPDAITRTCTRLDFARVCVMLHVSSKLPKYVVIMMPNELGGESACKVDVEYEWLPPKCTGCSSLGHSLKECPLSKPTKPAVSLYVRKSMPPKQAAPELKKSEQSHVDLSTKEFHPEIENDRSREDMTENSRDKSKDIVLFNAFDILRETDNDADVSSRGPNTCSPSDDSHVKYSNLECSGPEQEGPPTGSSRSC
ncbi:hypothetical protein Sango_3113300 [Sesamum angolense]|uniref:DUF4283 domain-containing protein n=1 Tax=Sesamum angolense TaxID=2727404 RepID=A0AAE1T8Y2_9LAMI|nr:hypothetical protein Sango_3113300 [Sesamum angolense]